jgi:hypothetical protein
MLQDSKGCLRMVVAMTIAALILGLTLLALATISWLTPGGVTAVDPTPPVGTPEEVGQALEEALDRR